jgi:acyl carrier protein
VNSTEEFIALMRDELGLAVTDEDIEASLDEIPGWDSLHLLWLLTWVERATGRQISLAVVLEAQTLRGVYEAVAA